MSSFSSLGLGTSAIRAAQRGLDTTGQNIANVSTVGYSRQRVDQAAVGAPEVPAMYSKYDGASGGVKVTGISRVRDEFLEARARTAQANLGNLTEQTKAYEAIERTMDEPSDDGLGDQLTEFWASWGKISANEKSDGPRGLVLENAKAVAGQLNTMSNQLSTQWTDTRTELEANITDVNKMAQDVAVLNDAIRNNLLNNVPANELSDQRDVLIEKISTLTGATTDRQEYGVVNVVLGGVNLVEGARARALDVTAQGDTATTTATWGDRLAGGAPAAPTIVSWAVGSPDLPAPATSTVTLGTGTISAQLTGLDATIPDYIAGLDDVAQRLATAVNTQQALGYTIDGTVGTDLFTPSSGTTITAGTIQVDPSVTSRSMALSSGNPLSGVLDSRNATTMAANQGATGGADETFSALVVKLGVAAQSIYRNADVAQNVADTADDARSAVSGVSIDEEMTNLMAYQHSYTAAARFITAIDETLQTLVNMVN